MGFFDNLPTLNEFKGGIGEQLTKFASKMMTDAIVLHDVLIDGAEDMTSQIDLLLVGCKGIYVVEVKNYSEKAKIYGDGRKDRWYYYLGGKKYDIYSPIKQNEKHIRYLKNALSDFGDIPMFSVVVMFCEDFKVSNVCDRKPSDTGVCNSLRAMRDIVFKLAEMHPEVLNEEQKQQIADAIVERNIKGKDARKEHKEKVKVVHEEQKSIAEGNLCPYCKSELVLRKGSYGEFYGCSNYPKCRFTKKKS